MRLGSDWEPSWDRLGGLLGPSWGALGAIWAHLGASLGRLGAILGPLGAVLGPLGAILESAWRHLGSLSSEIMLVTKT